MNTAESLQMSYVEGYSKAKQECEAEINELRSIVSRCARAIGNGAYVSPEASIDFMKKLPNEIELHTGKLSNSLDIARTHAEQLVDGIKTLNHMVREAIEELFGPVASLESEEAVLLRGPEPQHEAEAIIVALERVRDHVNKLHTKHAAIARRIGCKPQEECGQLGFMDPETGARECSLEVRGYGCLCSGSAETGEEIAKTLEGGA